MSNNRHTISVAVVIGITELILFTHLVRQAFANQGQGNNRKIAICLDEKMLPKLLQYQCVEGFSFDRNKSTRDENLKGLPVYPLSEKTLSVIDPSSSIFAYECRAKPELVTRFYETEMKRKGWQHLQYESSQETAMFVKRKALCLVSSSRDSGLTVITVVYLPEPTHYRR